MSKSNLETDAAINADLRAHGIDTDYRIFQPGEPVRILIAKNDPMVMDVIPVGSRGKFLATELCGDTVILRLEMDVPFNGPEGRTNVLEYYLDIAEDVSDYIA